MNYASSHLVPGWLFHYPPLFALHVTYYVQMNYPFIPHKRHYVASRRCYLLSTGSKLELGFIFESPILHFCFGFTEHNPAIGRNGNIYRRVFFQALSYDFADIRKIWVIIIV